MIDEVKEILVSESELNDITTRLANEINRDYAGEEVIFVGLLKGSFVFLSDLIKKVTVQCKIDFMIVSSYGASTVSSGKVNIKKDLSQDIADKHVIVVEDIVDSGITLNAVLALLDERCPKSLKLCSCLSKPSRRVKEVKIDYLGTEIPDEFVIGYGLDYDEKYRNLPYVAVIDPKYI